MGTCQTNCCNKELEYGLKTNQKSENNVDEGNPEFEDQKIKDSNNSQQKDKFQEDCLNQEQEQSKKNDKLKESSSFNNEKDDEQGEFNKENSFTIYEHLTPISNQIHQEHQNQEDKSEMLQKGRVIFQNYVKNKTTKTNYNLKVQNTDFDETMSNIRIKLGVKSLDKGAVYEGEWLKGKRDGNGKQIWPDGSIYEGQWVDDRCCGKGKLIHGDGDIYEGDWLEDTAQGIGIYQHKNGARYEGQWFNDKQQGKGVETWPDGTRYEGEYNDGIKEGQGTLYFADGSIYQGFFKNTSAKYGYLRGNFTQLNRKLHEYQWIQITLQYSGEICLSKEFSKGKQIQRKYLRMNKGLWLLNASKILQWKFNIYDLNT